MQVSDFLIPNLNQAEKRYLLTLAQKSLENLVNNTSNFAINESELTEALLKNGACFVTLKLNGNLRGCIGSVIAYRPLYLDVIHNATAAASLDPRFPKITQAELENIKIQISVLGELFEIKYNSIQDLFASIEPYKDGLVLKNGAYQGLFLPSVWEDLPSKDLFLSNLCLKAGFSPKLWHNDIIMYKFRTLLI